VVGSYPAAQPIEEKTVRIGDVIISYTNFEDTVGSGFDEIRSIEPIIRRKVKIIRDIYNEWLLK